MYIAMVKVEFLGTFTVNTIYKTVEYGSKNVNLFIFFLAVSKR